MNTQNNFIADLKSTIIDRLNDYRGGSYYVCDLPQTLFEGENANGSVLCNTYQTKEFIKANFDLFGQLVAHVNSEMDFTLNPFSEPEKAHVWLLLEASQSLISKLPTIEDNWNDKLELTDEVISILTNEINELSISEDDLF